MRGESFWKFQDGPDGPKSYNRFNQRPAGLFPEMQHLKELTRTGSTCEGTPWSIHLLQLPLDISNSESSVVRTGNAKKNLGILALIRSHRWTPKAIPQEITWLVQASSLESIGTLLSSWRSIEIPPSHRKGNHFPSYPEKGDMLVPWRVNFDGFFVHLWEDASPSSPKSFQALYTQAAFVKPLWCGVWGFQVWQVWV